MLDWWGEFRQSTWWDDTIRFATGLWVWLGLPGPAWYRMGSKLLERLTSRRRILNEEVYRDGRREAETGRVRYGVGLSLSDCDGCPKCQRRFAGVMWCVGSSNQHLSQPLCLLCGPKALLHIPSHILTRPQSAAIFEILTNHDNCCVQPLALIHFIVGARLTSKHTHSLTTPADRDCDPASRAARTRIGQCCIPHKKTWHVSLRRRNMCGILRNRPKLGLVSVLREMAGPARCRIDSNDLVTEHPQPPNDLTER
ncbi:hypothetical protein FB567DRAFT_42193 [Paraphoma chrysanthemicola]|uniref:Uncharacterized protein n=1 Tax=Paraphoma chrysanthemicola TaxID=798071 RepID=A0A8K0RL96_9PLEO|nr:hypothetical protein FB567DRAFT_42193 [Paraphoma chrysanthemicola]